MATGLQLWGASVELRNSRYVIEITRGDSCEPAGMITFEDDSESELNEAFALATTIVKLNERQNQVR